MGSTQENEGKEVGPFEAFEAFEGQTTAACYETKHHEVCSTEVGEGTTKVKDCKTEEECSEDKEIDPKSGEVDP